MKKQFILLLVSTISCFVSEVRSCCPRDPDSYPKSSYTYRGHPNTFAIIPKLITPKKYNPQSLVAVSCKSFVKNNLTTIEQQLSLHEIPNDHLLAKCLFTAVQSLPSEDRERFKKIVTILKKMPVELYGDLAFLINQYEETSSRRYDIEHDNEERSTLYRLLQYLPNPIENTHVETIEFFKEKISRLHSPTKCCYRYSSPIPSHGNTSK